jgi:hypothetical protein
VNTCEELEMCGARSLLPKIEGLRVSRKFQKRRVMGCSYLYNGVKSVRTGTRTEMRMLEVYARDGD